jgi:uncharacterized protein involved in exopolysaccharide biosynthesis
MQFEPGLLGYWLDIYRRWRIVAITALTAAVFAYMLSSVLTPVYQSTSIFYTPQNITAPDYVSGGAGLAQTPFVPATEEKAASINLGILRSNDVFKELHSRFPERSFGELRKNVSINVSREFMVEAVVRDTDPQLAARIANSFPELLREFQRSHIREHMDAVAAAARKELDNVEKRLGELRSMSGSQARQPSDTDTAETPSFSSLRGAADDELRATGARLRSVLLEASTQSLEPATPVVVVQEATPGERPVFPIPLLNAIVAAITGLALGCYYALFCAYLDRRRQVRTIRNLAAPVVAEKEFVLLAQAVRSTP